MSEADIYLRHLALERYLPQDACRACGAEDCRHLVAALLNGRCLVEQLPFDAAGRRRLKRVMELAAGIPRPPLLTVPRPIEPLLLPLNHPGPADPVLVTGNSELTQAVLMAVLAQAGCPLFVLFADTRGDTVDMALILGSMTVERLGASATALGLAEKAPAGRVVLPGLAADLAFGLEQRLGRPVEAGPVCAAELPLFLGEHWRWADE